MQTSGINDKYNRNTCHFPLTLAQYVACRYFANLRLSIKAITQTKLQSWEAGICGNVGNLINIPPTLFKASFEKIVTARVFQMFSRLFE